MGVGRDLDLDVPRGRHEALDIDTIIAERRARLAARQAERAGELGCDRGASLIPRPPPPPAALISSGYAQPGGVVSRRRSRGPRARQARPRPPARGHAACRRRARAPPPAARRTSARARGPAGEPRVLGQEAVARVDRVAAGAERGLDDRCRRAGSSAPPGRDRSPRSGRRAARPSRRGRRRRRRRRSRARAPGTRWTIRTAISPRLATNTRFMPAARGTAARRTRPARRSSGNLDHRPGNTGRDRVHHLHHLDDADDRVGLDPAADLDERRLAGALGAVEGAEHRGLDGLHPVGGRGALRSRVGRSLLRESRTSGPLVAAPRPAPRAAGTPPSRRSSSSSSESSMIRRISRTSSSLSAMSPERPHHERDRVGSLRGPLTCGQPGDRTGLQDVERPGRALDRPFDVLV